MKPPRPMPVTPERDALRSEDLASLRILREAVRTLEAAVVLERAGRTTVEQEAFHDALRALEHLDARLAKPHAGYYLRVPMAGAA